MRERPDLVTEASPKGLEVFQLTTDELPSSHIYMEAQIFTPDSSRFILHRSAHAHGSDSHDPDHKLLICDLENDGELSPITEELGATAPSVSPDNTTLYYFINDTQVGSGTLTLKRVNLDGTDRRTILAINGAILGTDFRLSHPYGLSTISSDGKRLAISAFLGNGKTEDAPWGLLVFDLEKASFDLIMKGQSWCNIHPQYSRSLDHDKSHDILIQENHGNKCNPTGEIIRLTGGKGADVHVIRDNGTNLRDMPWGRDGNEFCQGHQCWIGRTNMAITSTRTQNSQSAHLIGGYAVSHIGHLGIKTPGSIRNNLSRTVRHPDFHHFATDLKGHFFISDAGPRDTGGSIYLAELSNNKKDPLKNIRFLINPRSSWKKNTHIHPFLSPNGKTGFFNSDESGILQAYMLRGW